MSAGVPEENFTQIRTRQIRVELEWNRFSLCVNWDCARFLVYPYFVHFQLCLNAIFFPIQIHILIHIGAGAAKRWRYNFWFTKFGEFYPCIVEHVYVHFIHRQVAKLLQIYSKQKKKNSEFEIQKYQIIIISLSM